MTIMQPRVTISKRRKSPQQGISDESSSASTTRTSAKISKQQKQQPQPHNNGIAIKIPFHVFVALILSSNLLVYYVCTTHYYFLPRNNNNRSKRSTITDGSKNNRHYVDVKPFETENKNGVIAVQTSNKQNFTHQQENQTHEQRPEQELSLLSNEQSFGYFTDICNEDWRRFYQQPIRQQQQAANAVVAVPNATYWKQPRPPPRLDGGDDKDVLDARWLYHNYNPIFVCPHARKIGDPGGKWMCDPERFYHQVLRRFEKQQQQQQQQQQREAKSSQQNVSLSQLSRRPAPCLIYSVGSKGNFRWENEMVEGVLQGRTDLCEIHIFDPHPLSYYYPNPQELQQVQRRLLHSNMYYHAWGWIGTHTARPRRRQSQEQQSAQQPARINKANFKTLPETRRLLGHDQAPYYNTPKRFTLDILKLDCEGCEWETSADWLLNPDIDISHLLLETHSLPWSDQVRRTPYYGPFPALDVVHNFFERLLRVVVSPQPARVHVVTSDGTSTNAAAHHVADSFGMSKNLPEEEKNDDDDVDGAFVLYSKEVNTHRGEGRCVEWSFIKLRRDFFESVSLDDNK